MRLRKPLLFLIPAGLALISLRFIEPEIRHQRFRNHSKLFLSTADAYSTGRAAFLATPGYTPKFIRVEGEEGYNPRTSSRVWQGAIDRYDGAQNKGNTSLDLLLKNRYPEWGDWEGNMTVARLMRICDRLWRTRDIKINSYPDREYLDDAYEYNAGLEWCVDTTRSKPRMDTTVQPPIRG